MMFPVGCFWLYHNAQFQEKMTAKSFVSGSIIIVYF